MAKQPSSGGRKRGRPRKILAKAQLPSTLNLELSLPRSAPETVSLSLAPARTTSVYNSYWRFAAERQRIFYRRALWPFLSKLRETSSAGRPTLK